MFAGGHRNVRFSFRFPMAATIRIRCCPSPTTRVILQAAECHRGGLETLSPPIASIGWRLCLAAGSLGSLSFSVAPTRGRDPSDFQIRRTDFCSCTITAATFGMRRCPLRFGRSRTAGAGSPRTACPPLRHSDDQEIQMVECKPCIQRGEVNARLRTIGVRVIKQPAISRVVEDVL
jgi:hypothetical protein